MKKKKALRCSLAESSRAQNVGRELIVDVYVTGKGNTPFIIPKKISLRCGTVRKDCSSCRLGGSRMSTLTITAEDRRVLGLLGKADSTVAKYLRRWVNVCDDCTVEIISTQNVEELRVSPRTDVFLPASEYVARECYYIGHGLRPNRPYELKCYCYPDQTTQRAVLVVSEAKALRDMIETYVFDEVRESLEIFKGHPTEVFGAVYKDFASNIHRIVGREQLQVAFDLVFHSVLQFTFQGVPLRRGWTECFILGDSGQGKTEMSLCLLNHYGLGDRVQGEGSTTAGLIGGLERMGDRWILVWGKIPQMDRRLLIIDEFSGVSAEDIAKLSDIRSTGIAELTKIRTERASARTRLIMMSNTRDGVPIGAYNTGVEALLDVFGHAEDVRRLDFAMTVASGEVDVSLLHQTSEEVSHTFVSDACRDLILWAWSRTPEQVIFDEGVEVFILEESVKLSARYSSYIPLIEPADTRIKLARLAVACACRCFSADEEGNVIVKREHVEFIVNFLIQCYDSPYMSYDIFSDKARIETTFVSDSAFDACVAEFCTFSQWQEIARILSSLGNPFRGYELSEQLNCESFEVKEIIHFLSRHSMIKTLPAGYRKQPKLNLLLREVTTSVSV